MIHALLPDDTNRPLPFYLAMEEYLARRDDADYFFMWQVGPTVIVGRNQSLVSEVNIDYCRSHGINLVRRKSGGGCVYADRQNIMFSHITTSPEVVQTFARYTSLVASFLRSLGLDATAGGRNDVMIGDRKVSGNAFYHTRGRAIVHGTMLFNTDVGEMLHAITPSGVKLTSKGVASVKSRVTNIADHLDISIDEFKRRAVGFICDSELRLSAADVEAINAIAEPYFSSEWLYGSTPRAAATRATRIDGVGEISVDISLRDDMTIHSVVISGDYFPLVDNVEAVINSRLKGTAYTPQAIAEALDGLDVPALIRGLDLSQLISLITQ